MVTMGYKHLNESDCKGCQAKISWWETPKGKKIPMDIGTAKPHWEDCPNSGDFRSKAGGENIAVSKVSSGNCDFDGDSAVIRVSLGRGKTLLCASHANQLYIKLKNSGKKEG